MFIPLVSCGDRLADGDWRRLSVLEGFTGNRVLAAEEVCRCDLPPPLKFGGERLEDAVGRPTRPLPGRSGGEGRLRDGGSYTVLIVSIEPLE